MELSNTYLNQISNSIIDNKNKANLEILGQKSANSNNQEIKEIAEDFEAVFMTQMLQHMFSGVEVNEVFGGGHGEETFKTLLFDEYGKIISKAGGIGIAEHVQRELLEMQERSYE